MTVAELIELLKLCPPDLTVHLTYDSFCAGKDLSEGKTFITDEAVYLCAMSDDEVEYCLNNDDDRERWQRRGARRIRPIHENLNS